jgi:GntR family transcriptional regulator
MTTPPPKPLYVRLAEILEARIRSGEYPPGSAIPSYRDLRDGAGGEHVSWATAESAVALLVRQGWVERAGSTAQGMRVREHPEVLSRSHRGLGSDRMTWREAAGQLGMVGAQIVTSVGRQQAPPAVAIRMGLEPGSDVVVRRRLVTANDWPYQIAIGYYPVHLAAGTDLELQRGRMRSNAVKVLDRLGHPPTRFEEEVWSRVATAAEAAELRLSPGAPVLYIMRTCYSAAEAIEVAELVCAGDRMSCIYEIGL